MNSVRGTDFVAGEQYCQVQCGFQGTFGSARSLTLWLHQWNSGGDPGQNSTHQAVSGTSAGRDLNLGRRAVVPEIAAHSVCAILSCANHRVEIWITTMEQAQTFFDEALGIVR